MPVTRTLPYQWYDTPNIRVGTVDTLPNLLAPVAVFVIERQ
jgi:hypothetical protein